MPPLLSALGFSLLPFEKHVVVVYVDVSMLFDVLEIVLFRDRKVNINSEREFTK